MREHRADVMGAGKRCSHARRARSRSRAGAPPAARSRQARRTPETPRRARRPRAAGRRRTPRTPRRGRSRVIRRYSGERVIGPRGAEAQPPVLVGQLHEVRHEGGPVDRRESLDRDGRRRGHAALPSTWSAASRGGDLRRRRGRPRRSPPRKPTARGRRRAQASHERSALKASPVRLHDLRIRDRHGVGRKNRPNIPPTLSAAERHAASRAAAFRPSHKARVLRGKSVVEPGSLHQLQRREAGATASGLPDSVPGLVHGAERRDDLHDVAPAAVRGRPASRRR